MFIYLRLSRAFTASEQNDAVLSALSIPRLKINIGFFEKFAKLGRRNTNTVPKARLYKRNVQYLTIIYVFNDLWYLNFSIIEYELIRRGKEKVLILLLLLHILFDSLVVVVLVLVSIIIVLCYEDASRHLKMRIMINWNNEITLSLCRDPAHPVPARMKSYSFPLKAWWWLRQALLSTRVISPCQFNGSQCNIYYYIINHNFIFDEYSLELWLVLCKFYL